MRKILLWTVAIVAWVCYLCAHAYNRGFGDGYDHGRAAGNNASNKYWMKKFQEAFAVKYATLWMKIRQKVMESIDAKPVQPTSPPLVYDDPDDAISDRNWPDKK